MHPLTSKSALIRRDRADKSSHESSSMASQRNAPRVLTVAERARIEEYRDHIHYSLRYNDDLFEYRHVILPKNMLKVIPRDYFSENGTLRILFEDEWRGLGITQSLGWEHYETHAPEPHILLFKRPRPLDK